LRAGGGQGKGDERILGSGEFVGKILADSEKIERYKFLRKVSLSELVEKVSSYLDADKDEVLSGNRRQKNCHARGLNDFNALNDFNDWGKLRYFGETQ
jgi:hypothetical protein